MARKSNYSPGTPSWVDLGTPRLDEAAAFYSGLFGWETQVASEPDAGGYTMFSKEGMNVAGMGQLMSDEQPSAWSTYISVVDADASTELAAAAGAKILLEPMQIFDVGKMAILMDPTGAAISVWQPLLHHGADLVNEPGSLCWNELMTRDVDAATDFYGSVFGWHAITNTHLTPDGEMSYTEWRLGPEGDYVGGMIVMDGDEWPADLPSHWMVYFAVGDTDATAALCSELGGTVSVPPTDISHGRFAVLGDAAGAYFSVLRLST